MVPVVGAAKATPLPKLALGAVFLCNITSNFQMVRAQFKFVNKATQLTQASTSAHRSRYPPRRSTARPQPQSGRHLAG